MAQMISSIVGIVRLYREADKNSISSAIDIGKAIVKLSGIENKSEKSIIRQIVSKIGTVSEGTFVRMVSMYRFDTEFPSYLSKLGLTAVSYRSLIGSTDIARIAQSISAEKISADTVRQYLDKVLENKVSKRSGQPLVDLGLKKHATPKSKSGNNNNEQVADPFDTLCASLAKDEFIGYLLSFPADKRLDGIREYMAASTQKKRKLVKSYRKLDTAEK